jgi:hypothetical protein
MYARKFPWRLELTEDPVDSIDKDYETVLANKDDAKWDHEQLTDAEREVKKKKTTALHKVNNHSFVMLATLRGSRVYRVGNVLLVRC